MEIEFTVSGRRVRLSREGVLSRLRGVVPGAIQAHVVEIEGRTFPVKQVLATATGLDPLDFNTNQARRVLRALGFTVERVS